MTTTETAMQRIERAERDGLRAAREDPTARRDREAAERDAIAADQRAEREAIAEVEREAASAALIIEEAARARATQLADDEADELRIVRVLALARIINEAESTLQPQIAKAQQVLDTAIADDAGPEVLYRSWATLRTASAELWHTTAAARHMIQLAKGEAVTGTAPGDPLDGYTFDAVCSQAIAARAAAPAAAATARVAAAYNDASATATKRVK